MLTINSFSSGKCDAVLFLIFMCIFVERMSPPPRQTYTLLQETTAYFKANLVYFPLDWAELSYNLHVALSIETPYYSQKIFPRNGEEFRRICSAGFHLIFGIQMADYVQSATPTTDLNNILKSCKFLRLLSA